MYVITTAIGKPVNLLIRLRHETGRRDLNIWRFVPGLFPPGWSTSSCGWCMAAVQKAGTARYGRTLLRCGLCAKGSDAIHGCCCTLMSFSGPHRHIVPGLFVGCWGTYLLQTTESSDHDVDPQDDPVLALQKLLGMKLVHLDGLVKIQG